MRRLSGVRVLTDEEVMFFRGEYYANPQRLTSRKIMEMTNLSMNSIQRMLRGDTYGHVSLEKLREEQREERKTKDEAKESEERMKAWARKQGLLADDSAEEMLKELGEVYGAGEKT